MQWLPVSFRDGERRREGTGTVPLTISASRLEYGASSVFFADCARKDPQSPQRRIRRDGGG
jgi:hypothetical protein